MFYMLWTEVGICNSPTAAIHHANFMRRRHRRSMWTTARCFLWYVSLGHAAKHASALLRKAHMQRGDEPADGGASQGGPLYECRSTAESAERTVRLCSLWPESFALLNKSWQSVAASHDLFLLSLILPTLPVYALEKPRKKTEKKVGERGGSGSITTGGSVESLFPWKWRAAARGHYQFRGIDCRSRAIFNLLRWIGRHACRGIDKATAFVELRLMSLSFGGWPGYSQLSSASSISLLVSTIGFLVQMRAKKKTVI